MRKRELKNMEWGILIIAIILSIIGLVALFSATQETGYDEFKKQIIWFMASLIIMVIVMLINYEILVKLSPIFYGIFIILLIAVLFTTPVNGATSWFNIGSFSFQPSEFAKIVVILFLALIISKMQEKYAEDINKPTRLLIIIGALAVPLLLIIKQPDYGTAMAFCIALAIMLFTSGIDKKYIIGALIIVCVSIPILYNFILPDHAKKRIDIFLNPESDPRGSGYNIIQSKLAIGAGGLSGMGLLKGNQTQLGYLYPKTTDFIYSVIGEEMGFIIARYNYSIVRIANNQNIIYSQNSQRPHRSFNSIRNSRNILIPYGRKYRNGNGVITNNRCAITICKLRRKLSNNKLYFNRNIIKY
ncbi:MAG: rod shape-determining protein RodA [Clostridia bacterium]|nr:rod shape-determining protein RodA [Clostridia bacterium]